MKTAWTLVLAAAAACGGTAKPDSTANSPTGQGASPQSQSDRKASIEKFHDTLAPRWHAAQGPQRMADACAAVPQLQADASAIATTQGPGDAASWSTHTKELGDAVVALDATCKANDAAAFEPAFERLHNSFHSVMEASGGHGKEHGKGEHGKGEHGKGEHGKGEHDKGKEHSEAKQGW
jgi:hypothetical protein